MTLKVYLDFLSQPCRALYIFLKLNKVPFELCPVALRKGVHLTEEFKEKYNRFQRVPFIHDGNFKLSESVAIVRYVADKYNLDTNWYPKDIQKRAQVDEYLEWQHTNTRAFCALYFQKKWLIPLLTGKTSTPDVIKKHEENMSNCLDTIEKVWLNNTPYLSGNQISVADVFAACEIEQPSSIGFDPTNGRPTLSAWLNRVRNEVGPVYKEAHAVLEKITRAKEGASAKL